MNVIAKLYRGVIPEKIRYMVYDYRANLQLNRVKKSVTDYYKANPSSDSEINEALKYLAENKLAVFPYQFSKKYNPNQVEVYTDSDSGLNYVFLNSNKLFFKRGLTEKQIKHAYSFLLCEQDSESPHCYLTQEFTLNDFSTLADVGCAEGIFSLMNIENVKSVVLFEADKDWVEALEKTFEPWKDKVTIVNKFVSDKTENEFIKLDDYFNNLKPDFLKIDVDGAEEKLLAGATQLIATSKMKIALCTYHKQNDAIKFDKLLKNYNYKTSFSKNYMLFYFDEAFHAPYFRKALIRAHNYNG